MCWDWFFFLIGHLLNKHYSEDKFKRYKNVNISKTETESSGVGSKLKGGGVDLSEIKKVMIKYMFVPQKLKEFIIQCKILNSIFFISYSVD